MRRIAALAAVVALTAGSCSGGDRYLPKFGPAQTVVKTNGPVTFTVATNGDIYYAELRTNDVYVVARGSESRPLFTADNKPDSLAIDTLGDIYLAKRTKGTHKLYVSRYEENGINAPAFVGAKSRLPAHIAITPEQLLIVGRGDALFSLKLPGAKKRTVVSTGWTDPIVTIGRGSRIWVADNALPGERERVARGREKSVSKRNRFASTLPPYTNPSGMALLDGQLLVCSRTHKKVYRLHIGLDDVARRRGWMKGLVCDRDIAAAPDGSLITATNGAIYKYPPR